MPRKKPVVLAEADEFMESFGQFAYQEARYGLQKAIERSDYECAKFLLSVCSEISSRTDFEPASSEQEPFELEPNKSTTIH